MRQYCPGAKTDPKMPKSKVSSEGKNPSASQDESGGATIADPESDLLAIMTKKLEEIEMKSDKKFEEINKRFVDQDKRIEGLRQEWKSGDNNPLVAAGGGATLPGNQAPPPSQRVQVPRPVLPEVESPVRYSRVSLRDVQPAGKPHVPWKLNPPVFSGDSSDYLSFRKKPSCLQNTLASVTFSPVLEMFQWPTLRFPPNE